MDQAAGDPDKARAIRLRVAHQRGACLDQIESGSQMTAANVKTEPNDASL